MKVIDNSALGRGDPLARETSVIERIRSRLRGCLTRLRRRLPHVIWAGQEVDVHVTLMGAGPDFEARAEGDGSRAIRQAQTALHEAGIQFDSGGGLGVRDWQWDYSLNGPISVTLVGKARRPDRRREALKPRLVVSNPAA